MKKILLTIALVASIFGTWDVQTIFAATTQPTVQTETHTQEPELATETTEHAEEEDTGVVGLFGLDWKLFLAQLINFGIVLFVLWKWVFKPVTSGMEARTKKIEDSLLDADKIQKEKILFEEWKAAEMGKARKEATEIISEAKTTAERTKDQIVEQTKLEQQGVLERTQAQLAKERELVVSQAKEQLADLVVGATERLLKSKLNAKTDQKLISDALKEVGD